MLVAFRVVMLVASLVMMLVEMLVATLLVMLVTMVFGTCNGFFFNVYVSFIVVSFIPLVYIYLIANITRIYHHHCCHRHHHHYRRVVILRHLIEQLNLEEFWHCLITVVITYR